jgi:hypothetical protein
LGDLEAATGAWDAQLELDDLAAALAVENVDALVDTLAQSIRAQLAGSLSVATAAEGVLQGLGLS